MPVKSRGLLDELYDPSLAYWPDDYSWRYRRTPRRRSLYNNWVNCLVDELLDPKSNEIQMEIENGPEANNKVKDQLKDQPMELDRTEEVKSNDKKVEPKNVNDKLVESNNNKAVVNSSKPTELSLRLNDYKPEDITVKVKDNQLTIKGKKEKRSGSSYSCHQFERTFTLPKDCDRENILCSMDANGLIKLNIPHKDKKEEEIKINVEQSNELKDDEPIVEDLKED